MVTRGAEGPRAENFAVILAAAQAGASWATTELWLEYAPAVTAFLRARGSREPDDLASDVFLVVFDQLPKFLGRQDEFRSFVFTIAYRRLVDELRRRSRRGETAALSESSDPRRVVSAEDAALARIGEASTLSLLDALPGDQRTVMILRIIADLTIDQIADVIGKRPGAIKALQRRALDSLRKKFELGRTPAANSGDSEK